jgi:hypothetical protein
MPGIVSCADRSAPLASMIGPDIPWAVLPSSPIQIALIMTFCAAASEDAPVQKFSSLARDRCRSSDALDTAAPCRLHSPASAFSWAGLALSATILISGSRPYPFQFTPPVTHRSFSSRLRLRSCWAACAACCARTLASAICWKICWNTPQPSDHRFRPSR